MAEEMKDKELQQTGQEKTAPAAPAQKEEPASPATQSSDFKGRIWQPFLKPVVALVVITMLTSLLLGLTNMVTAPIIKQNTLNAAEAARQELLPEADAFEEIIFATKPDGITSMFKAKNGVGYVIEAYGTGYGGKVPVMVAFNQEGTIVGIKFLENSETPGLGQKLVTDEKFSEQFIGLPNERITLAPADRIANATISSNAAASAVNAAIELLNEKVMGQKPGTVELTPEQVREKLLPNATSFTQLAVDAPKVIDAYAADDGNFIIYTEEPGFYSGAVTAAVAVTPDGKILAVWADTSNETKGFGYEVDNDQAFLDQFTGLSSGQVSGEASQVDAVGGATITSGAFGRAVQSALDALETVKEAA